MFKALGKAPRRAFAKNLIRTVDPRRRALMRYAVGVSDEGVGEIAYVVDDWKPWLGAYKRRDAEWIRFHHETLGWPIPSAERFWLEVIKETDVKELDLLKYLWDGCKGIHLEDFIKYCAAATTNNKGRTICTQLLDQELVFTFVEEAALIEHAFEYDALWLLHWTRERTKNLEKWSKTACRISGTTMSSGYTFWGFECINWMTRHVMYCTDRDARGIDGQHYVGSYENMMDSFFASEGNGKASIYATIIAFWNWYCGTHDCITSITCERIRNLEAQGYARKLGMFHEHGRCKCRRNN